MTAEATIQLPQDAIANKNLLRALQMIVDGATIMQQVITVGGIEGGTASVVGGSLQVVDDSTTELLRGITRRLDVIASALDDGYTGDE